MPFVWLRDDNALSRLVHRGSASGVGLTSHILAYAFAMHFLFGSVSVVNALELSFFYYFPRKIQIIIVDARTDAVIWVVSVAFASILAVISLKGRRESVPQIGTALVTMGLIAALLASQGSNPPEKLVVHLLFFVATAEFVFLALRPEPIFEEKSGVIISRVLIYLLVTYAVIEISSGTHFIVKCFDPATPVGSADAGIELQFSYASYGLLPLLYAAFLSSWAWVPIVQKLSPNAFKSFLNPTSASHEHIRGHPSRPLDYRTYVAFAVAAFIGYYPYFQNPPWLVGTDAYWRYYDPLLRMNVAGTTGALAQALRERHSVALLLFYGAERLLDTTPFEVVRLAPLFLVMALGLATSWFLASKKSTEFALIVFVFSFLSPITTMGLHTSILANWMALVAWMFFFGYVAWRGDVGLRARDTLVLLATSTIILLLHPWTWGLFATSVVLFVISNLVQEKRNGLRPAAILLWVIATDALLILDLLRGGQAWRLSDALDLYTRVIGNPASLLVSWDALVWLTKVWAAFFSPLQIATCILGVFYLQRANLTPWRRRLTLALLCATGIGSILAAPIGFDPTRLSGNRTLLWRLFFLTPFQLTAPLGVVAITQFARQFRAPSAKMEDSHGAPYRVWFVLVFAVGVLLAWAPIHWRLVLILCLFPVTGIALAKCDGQERNFLSDIVMVTFVLVAFNYATRSLAQLLIDPHNYRA